MNILKIIRDTDFGLDYPAPKIYKERQASRAIVFDENKYIALLYVTKKHYHKLPGGGIEKGEKISAALKRELLEEIGCSVKDVRELGAIEEYRNKLEFHQISYCFLANLVGDKGVPHFEEDEITDGFQVVWMDMRDAIKTLESEINVKDYREQFIRLRDFIFLKEAAKTL